ncbi:MAG: hypothetical protein DRP08_04760 [Candidatus Aenigmatarchaeota archaeon]|nr:MAG: hypothetical protein DRP08_04760 [Candidatus Aenigmarchaeota archaeon]
MKIKLNEKEIELIICVLEASLGSEMPCRYAESLAGKFSSMETRRKKAELIEMMKETKNKI